MFTSVKKPLVFLLCVAMMGRSFAADPDFGPSLDDLNGGTSRGYFQPNSPSPTSRSYEDRGVGGVAPRIRRDRSAPLSRPSDMGRPSGSESWSRDSEFSQPAGRPSYDSLDRTYDRSRDLGSRGNYDLDRSMPSNGRSYESSDFRGDSGTYRSNYRLGRPANPGTGPTIPQAAPRKSTTLTLDEKISRRYADPRMIRLMSGLNGQAGYGFFSEISQMIDERHIQPTSYQQRVDRALEQLSKVPSNPAFQQAVQIDPRGGENFAASVHQMRGSVRVADLNGAMQTMQQVAQLSSQTAGIPEGVIALEFATASLDGLDPYSMIMPPEKTGSPTTGLSGSMVGIGVEIESHPQGLKILKALAGGPAAEATLKKGDLITAINGRNLEGLELQQAVDLLTGGEGSSVALTLRRGTMVGDVTLTRRHINLKSVSEVRMIDPTNHVGYLKLETFAEKTSGEMDEALWALHEQGMESLVIDLRGNPGGLLTTAIEVCDKFLPGGVIVSTRGRNPQDNSQEVATKEQTWKVPLVVMVDHNSASASEIFAAAIQDNQRGIIVGERSYGKGTVQTLFPLQSAPAGLRLTTAKFYAPSGREMAGTGVTPDQTIRVMDDASGNDVGLNDALSIAVRQFTTMNEKHQVAKTR